MNYNIEELERFSKDIIYNWLPKIRREPQLNHLTWEEMPEINLVKGEEPYGYGIFLHPWKNEGKLSIEIYFEEIYSNSKDLDHTIELAREEYMSNNVPKIDYVHKLIFILAHEVYHNLQYQNNKAMYRMIHVLDSIPLFKNRKDKYETEAENFAIDFIKQTF